jgi:uncharacterized repeat protein (TIGR01451 family)
MKHFVYILLISLTLSSCSNKDLISVVDTNFGDSIDVQQNLLFKFNQDLIPDSLIEKWDTLQYVSIQPSVKGLFKWVSKNELVFSPSGSFKPATSYTGTLTKLLSKHSKKSLTVNSEKIKFKTAELNSVGLQSWWTLSDQSADELALMVNIDFNYAVDPAEISKLLIGRVNNKEVVIKMLSTVAGKQIQVRLNGIKRSEALNGNYKIVISKGAKCVECTEENKKPLIIEGTLTPIEELQLTNIETDYDNNEVVVYIYSNQPVNEEDLKSKIKITPLVKFNAEVMESGIVLRGDFITGMTYEIQIDASLKGLLGGTMKEVFIRNISFGQQEPAIVFTHSKGMYLSAKGTKNVGIQIVNIAKVEVNVVKIYENNILSFMRQNRYNEWYDSENESGSSYSYSDYDLSSYGDVIVDKEYTTKNLPKVNGYNLLNLDFADEVPFKGIYLLSIRSSENQWLKATKLISVSDIGLLARASVDEVIVFANSIKEAKPMAGITVNVLSTNNQILFSGITNGDGVAKFTGLQSKYPNFNTGMITARSGGDFNYMLLSDARVELSRFETGGFRDNPSGYMCYIYGDREIYRPGDSIFVNSIVRTKDWKPTPGMPIKIKLLLPNGREFTTLRKTTDSQGSCESKFAIPSGGVTGQYTIEMYSGNDVLLSSKSINIEEFIPDRISLKLNVNKKQFAIQDSVKLNADATNLFGPPAANRNYEVQLNLNRAGFNPDKYGEYNFTINGADKIGFPSVVRSGKTKNDGSINEVFEINPAYKETGKLIGKIYATVFDETGRPVNRITNFDVYTQNVFLGVKSNEYYYGIGKPVEFNLVALNTQGNHIATNAQYEIVKINYNNVLEKTYGDNYHFVSQRSEKVLFRKQTSFSRKVISILFTPNESGEYALRLYNQDSERYVEQTFYAYGWGSTNSGAFKVNTEGTIDIIKDKDVYRPGDKAKLLFKTPFNGTLIVTIERNKVMEYHYLKTDKKTAEYVLTINDQHLPNIYVTATLFRALDDGTIPLTVAHGVEPILVEKPSTRLPLEIVVAEKSRSNRSQLVTVKTKPSSDVKVTIAIVDEGILQLRNTKSPDPHNFFYQKRALENDAYDVYPYLLPDLKLKRSSTGGDGFDLSKRVNPITNKRIKLVAKWSGILKTNSAGIASYTLKIPAFSGDLRVMAVAYENTNFGSAEAHIKVSDPIIISASLPRFVAPGDTLIVPVTFTNTLSSDQTIEASISSVGGIKIVSQPNEKVTIKSNSEQRVSYKLVASMNVGEAIIKVNAKNSSEVFNETTDITIRPAASLQIRNGSGVIKGGSQATIDLATDFIPSTTENKLVISKSPVVSFADQLSYLMDYPHGCAEQTISIAFPQLYFTDLAKVISNNPRYTVNVGHNVQAAIGKLQSLQTYNGGISTWQGDNSENWWTSIYCAHFFSEANKLGYNVNQKSMDKLFDYLSTKVKLKNSETLFYYDGSSTLKSRTIPSKDIFYCLYVLALNGRSDRSTMNYYKSNFSNLAIDSKYLLACSYLLINDRKSYNELLPSSFVGEISKQSNGGNYYSYLRDESLSLNALLTVDPNQIQVADIANRLSKEIRSQKWMNTQERAFSFLALGKFMKMSNAGNITASIDINNGNKYAFNGSDLIIDKNIANAKVSVSTEGSGNLYYFYISKGISSNGKYLQEDENFKVRKKFLNRFGKEISGNTFAQNDLVVVKITLENQARNSIENVVVTDMLPAGFEIENPRISVIPELEWIKDNSDVQYMDIRDDRINLYTEIGSKPKYFYYVVRAVSTGNFTLGPVSADAMYDGSYHSTNGAGRIKIFSK